MFASVIVSGAAEATKSTSTIANSSAIDFVKHVRPIFETHCWSCHGAEKQKGGLRLDQPEAVTRGADSGPVVVPGRSGDSRLIQLVTGQDPDEVMPPKGERLNAELISLLKAWIDQGAHWPASVGESSDEPALWSLRPVRKPPVPVTRNKAWARTAMDHFVKAQLEAHGLEPAPEADRPTLIRRLSFDLLGLPPTPLEIDTFQNDHSPLAWENLIERLLASPRYGERWGRHWLDVVRYTESQGFEYDRIRDNAWHYRDYVIRSFNADKPFDQFIREQIAGDVLTPQTRDGIIATSFLVCGPWDEAGSGQANLTQRAITREEELEELVGVVGQSFLGMTVNCARCHSHKFDPIPQEDYYRIKSVFEGIRHGERPLATDEESRRREERVASQRREMAQAELGLTRLSAKTRARWRTARSLEGANKTPIPTATARWTFESESPGVDPQGLPFTLEGNAMVESGFLVLNGTNGYLRSGPLLADVREKTLEAWVCLTTRDQAGGGVITIEDSVGKVFDSLVYGEREPRKWIAGSENYVRTRNLNGAKEDAVSGEFVHVAAVYGPGDLVKVYRDGKQYGEPYTPKAASLRTFRAGDARVLIGLRHSGSGNGLLAAFVDEAALYDRALTAEEVAALAARGRMTGDDLATVMTPPERASQQRLEGQLSSLREELERLSPLPRIYAGLRRQPDPTYRLQRGDVKSPREIVSAAGLSAIKSPSPDFKLPPDAPEAERRRQFAEWVADPKNPLPARVLANRIWHYHFGIGLVATPNDFGNSGARPSHPELLDWLAATLVESGWSVKQLHRLIVNSATYRQSSRPNEKAAAIDADNRLLWRFTPHRLEAEALRDALLAAAGSLNLQSGGPGFRSFDIITFNSSIYVPVDKPGPEFERRAVYRINVNSGKDPLLDAFDCPDPSVKTPRRGITTTPLQALGLMNNPLVQRASAQLARRSMSEARDDLPRAVGTAYRLTLGRPPTKAETERALEAATARGLSSVCWALFNSTEFLYVR